MTLHNSRSHFALLLVVFLLSGCASTFEQTPIPASISQAPTGNLQLVEAVGQPKHHLGTRVRWGGRVITVRSVATGITEIEILERRLDEQGRPAERGPSDGRFLVRATQQVDADLYQVGSQVTVAGIFEQLEQRQVGNTTQSLALVKVSDFIQWEDPYPDYRYRHRYRPFYGPPYYRWPYYFPNFHLGLGFSN